MSKATPGQRASAVTPNGRLKAEIHPLDGVEEAPLIPRTPTLEALSRLPPVFDRSAAGTNTAGKSSSLTDGAAAVLVMG